MRLNQRAGGLDPDDTGGSVDVEYGPGQVGEVVRFVHWTDPGRGVDFDAVVVRWDAQIWYPWKSTLDRMQGGKLYAPRNLLAWQAPSWTER